MDLDQVRNGGDPFDVPVERNRDYLDDDFGPYMKQANVNIAKIASPGELRVQDSKLFLHLLHSAFEIQ